MREILFRGKRVDNGEWVEGFYSPVRLPIIGEMGHFINEDGYRAIEVKKETVCEFTGLTDKNDTKIFEGDIVKWTDEYFNDYKSEVIYCCDKYNYPAFDFEKHDYECNGLQYAHENCYLEVIGNIYDNFELLQENMK